MGRSGSAEAADRIWALSLVASAPLSSLTLGRRLPGLTAKITSYGPMSGDERGPRGSSVLDSAPRSALPPQWALSEENRAWRERRCQAPEKGVGPLSAEEEKQVRITDLGSFHELWLWGRREGEGSRSRAKRRGREATSQSCFLTINF